MHREGRERESFVDCTYWYGFAPFKLKSQSKQHSPHLPIIKFSSPPIHVILSYIYKNCLHRWSDLSLSSPTPFFQSKPLPLFNSGDSWNLPYHSEPPTVTLMIILISNCTHSHTCISHSYQLKHLNRGLAICSGDLTLCKLRCHQFMNVCL